MIRGVHHTALATRDIDRLVAFYRDVVGFSLVWTSGWDAGSDVIDGIVGLKGSSAKQVMLQCGNCYLEIFEYVTPQPGAGDPNRPVNEPGYTHICLDVTDIEYEYKRLSQGGMRFHCAPPMFEGAGMRATYGRDPDGNVIEIQEIMSRDVPFHPAHLPKAKIAG